MAGFNIDGQHSGNATSVRGTRRISQNYSTETNGICGYHGAITKISGLQNMVMRQNASIINGIRRIFFDRGISQSWNIPMRKDMV